MSDEVVAKQLEHFAKAFEDFKIGIGERVHDLEKARGEIENKLAVLITQMELMLWVAKLMFSTSIIVLVTQIGMLFFRK